MKKVDSISDQGNLNNEDFAFVNEDFGILLDGATGLHELHVTNYGSDTQWFSHELGKLLKTELTKFDFSIGVILKECCDILKRQYDEFLAKQDRELVAAALPTCTVSIFRINRERLEIFQLGDSPIIIEEKSDVSFFCDENITKLDASALAEMVRLAAEKQTDILTERASIQNQLIANRALKNTEGGYWILDILGQGIPYGLMKNFEVAEVKNIAMMSDGFWELQETFRQYESNEAFLDAVLQENSLKEMVAQLRILQTADEKLNEFPRMKKMDDASLVYYRVENDQ